MRVTVRTFAVLRELRRVDTEQLDVPPGTTAGGLCAQLFPEPPVQIALAVNSRWVGADTPLTDGDVLALLPPLGGG